MIQSVEHRYGCGKIEMIGRLVWDDSRNTPAPGVLVAPSFRGLSDFEVDRAKELAALGYVALAVDYYGDGKVTTDREEAGRWMGLVNRDRPSFARRMHAALDSLKANPLVDESRTAGIGYCLGGKAVLDLARTGGGFQACVPIHGVYDPPLDCVETYKPAMLVLHGWDDPLARPEALTCLAEEMTERARDWQILAFGHTGHAFTNPQAQDAENHMMYSDASNRRSWNAMTGFLAEQLAA